MTIEENVQLKLDGHLSDHDTVDDFRVKISFSDGKYHDITFTCERVKHLATGRAIRVKRDFCSQCDGQVFYEDKKCRNCGAEFSDE